MHRNSGRDERRRLERLRTRQRRAVGYATTAELGELEEDVLRLLALTNGRRGPPATLGVDHVRLAVAAVAWGASRWAWIENDHVYPRPKTLAFAARADDKVAIRILSPSRVGGPDALFGHTWVHYSVDRTIRMVDPSTFRWTVMKFDHVPSEDELRDDDAMGLRGSRRGHGFRSNLAAAEGLVRSGRPWSLEAARAFSAPASDPAPMELSEAWESLTSAYHRAREALATRDWLAFPYEEAASLMAAEIDSAGMDSGLAQWTLRCALPSRIAEDNVLRASDKTAAFRRHVVSRSFEAARRAADSVAPLDCSAPMPLVMRPVRDWTCGARHSSNPRGDLERLRRRADAGDPEALRRYRSMVEARIMSVAPWEDEGFSKTFHEVLEDLRPGSSSKKDVSGWGEVIPDMGAYVDRALDDEPHAPQQRLVAGGVFLPRPHAAREFAWLHRSGGRPPLAKGREFVAVAYVLGWKHKGTEPIKGVALSLIGPIQAAALEARVQQAGCQWVSGTIHATDPKDEWGRKRLFVEGHDEEPLHESGRRQPGSDRTG